MRDGWKPRSLYELADYINGRPTKPAEVVSDGIPVIKIAELTQGFTSKTVHVSRDVVQARHIVKSGDLLFAWSGSIGIHRYSGPEGALNQHIFRVIAADGIDDRFLQYLLEAQVVRFHALTAQRKITMGHVRVSDLKHMAADVPPLAEQRRIADLIASIDGSLSAAREAASRSTELFRALLEELVGAPDNGRKSVGDLITDIVGGKSPRCADRPPGAGEWGVLRLSAVSPLGFRATEAKTLPAEVEPHLAGQVNTGDVLITRSNTRERVGLVSYVDDEPRNLLLSDLIWKLVPAPGVDPRYLAYALSCRSARDLIEAAASGTSGSMQKINRTKLKTVAVPVPSELDRQIEVTDTLDLARGAIARCEAEAERLAVLRGRLVRALISGEHEIPESYDRFLDQTVAGEERPVAASA